MGHLKAKTFDFLNHTGLHFEEAVNFVVDLVEPLLFALILFTYFECGNQVDNLILILDRVDPPIVNNECKLTHFLIGLFVISIIGKTFSHNGDQHIEQMDTHEETKQEEDWEQNWRHIVFEIDFRVEFSQRR